MARRAPKPRPDFELPAELVPDFDDWGSEVEEEKRRRREEWLRETGDPDRYFFGWLPAYVAERRKLAGLPTRPPARRRGPLPDRVRKALEALPKDNDDV